MIAPLPFERRSDARPGPPRLDRDQAEQIARTLRAIADPTRLQLLSMIQGSALGEATVSDLALELGVTQPTVSHHMRIMLDDGLVIGDQRGRQTWYSIHPDRRAAVDDLLQ